MSQLTYTTYSASTLIDLPYPPSSPPPTIYNATSLRSSRSLSPSLFSAVSSAAPSPRAPSVSTFGSEETIFSESDNATTTTAATSLEMNSGYVSARGTAYHVYTGRKEGVDSGSERAEMMTVNIVTVNDERGRGRVREYRR